MKKFLIIFLGFFAVLTVNARDPSLQSLRESPVTKPLLEFKKNESKPLDISFIKGTIVEDYFDQASFENYKEENEIPKWANGADCLYLCTWAWEYFSPPDDLSRKGLKLYKKRMKQLENSKKPLERETYFIE